MNRRRVVRACEKIEHLERIFRVVVPSPVSAFNQANAPTSFAPFGCNIATGNEYMKPRSLLSLLVIAPLVPFLVAGTKTSRSTQSSESYEVYSALIPHIAALPQKKFLIAADTVSYAYTKVRFPVEPENLVTEEELDTRLATATPSEWSNIWKSQPCVLAPEAERKLYLSAMVD